MKKRLGRLFFRIARIRAMGTFVGFMFTCCPFLIPIKKIRQNKSAVSMKHPAASYPAHVLIIPRKIARTIFNLTPKDFMAIIEMTVEIRKEDDRDFSLIINGGSRQDVMQAHFHLFTGNMAVEKALEGGKTFCPTDACFWERITSNLRELLKENNLTEASFSLLIQFEKGFSPSLYFF